MTEIRLANAGNPIPIYNETFALPGLSLEIPSIGAVSLTSLYVRSGSYEPNSSVLRVTDGSISFNGGFGSPANITGFTLQSFPDGVHISGTGCIQSLLGPFCRGIVYTIPYTSSFTQNTYLSLFKRTGGRRYGAYSNYAYYVQSLNLFRG